MYARPLMARLSRASLAFLPGLKPDFVVKARLNSAFDGISVLTEILRPGCNDWWIRQGIIGRKHGVRFARLTRQRAAHDS
jgi:hypothetical protein